MLPWCFHYPVCPACDGCLSCALSFLRHESAEWLDTHLHLCLQEVLRKLRSRLTRLAKTAEDFRQMASPDWAPRIGAYINAAHWMAHSLQEAAGPLLLLDLEGQKI